MSPVANFGKSLAAKHRQALAVVLGLTRRIVELVVIRLTIPLYVKKFRHLGSVEEGKPGPLVMIPHGDAGSRLFYRLISEVISSTGQVCRVYNGKPRWEETDTPHAIERLRGESKTFESFSGAIDFLETLAEGDPIVARGIIDEFLLKCPAAFYAGEFRVPNAFVKKMRKEVGSARRLVQDARGVIVGESSYAYSRTLVSATASQSIPMWAMVPGGYWTRVTPDSDESFFSMTLAEVEELLDGQPAIRQEIRRYLSRRFLGLEEDKDSPLAYSGANLLPAELHGKKILALHVFRDASQLPLRDSGSWTALFRTYYEWTDFVLSTISNKADDWAIRPHPSSHLYRNEKTILSRLLEKHGLEDIARADSVSTAALISHHSPIYTFNGTIALETAISGYRAFTSANFYPESIVSFAHSKNELQDHLHLPFQEATPPIDPSISPDAVGYFLRSRYFRPLSVFEPWVPDDRSSLVRREWSDLVRASFFLFKLRGRHGQKAIEAVLDDIMQTVRTSGE